MTIDLRSDTVTRPTAAMRAAMAAELRRTKAGFADPNRGHRVSSLENSDTSGKNTRTAHQASLHW